MDIFPGGATKFWKFRRGGEYILGADFRKFRGEGIIWQIPPVVGEGGYGYFLELPFPVFRKKNLRKKLYVNLFDQGKDNRFFFHMHEKKEMKN